VTFLHPLVLVALAAAGVPALLHLFQRRVPPAQDFPALRYLSEAERKSARRLKLRHLLLLVLRTVLVAVVVLAAARPLARTPVGAAHVPTALVVILDNSPSSAAVEDGKRVLDRLKAVARASLAQTAAGDRVWLVQADGVVRGGSRDDLLAALDAAGVASRRLDLVTATERAARLVDAEPLPAREVEVVSDLQRSALETGHAAVPAGVRVLAFAPPGPPPVNRGIGAVSVTARTLSVTIEGTPGAAPAPVTARLRGQEIGRALGAPGQTVTLPLPALPPGWWTGEVALQPDELRADDRRPFVWRVPPPAAVAAGADAGPFVAAALGVLSDAGRVRTSGVAGVTIGTRAGPAAAVVLPPADPALVGQANRMIAARGGAWRFAPEATPGPLASRDLPMIAGVEVARRYRLLGPAGTPGDTAAVLATVNGEPWLVADGSLVLVGSPLDTAWTALPASPGFVSFLEALIGRVARGESPVATAEGVPGVTFSVRGADTLGATVSGPDPRESDLTPADPGEVARALAADVEDSAGFAARRFASGRERDLSGLLLLFALALAVTELSVATLTR